MIQASAFLEKTIQTVRTLGDSSNSEHAVLIDRAKAFFAPILDKGRCVSVCRRQESALIARCVLQAHVILDELVERQRMGRREVCLSVV